MLKKLIKLMLNKQYGLNEYKILELQLERESNNNIRVMDLECQVIDLKCRILILELKLNKGYYDTDSVGGDNNDK